MTMQGPSCRSPAGSKTVAAQYVPPLANLVSRSVMVITVDDLHELNAKPRIQLLRMSKTLPMPYAAGISKK